MGQWFSRLYGLFAHFGDGPASRILMLGLGGAGKTTILYRMQLNETVSTIPTIGFNVETVSPRPGLTFTVWDVGAGSSTSRPLWRHYFPNTDGLFYVIDSSDREQIEEVKDELLWIFVHCDELVRGVPVEIIANKQDLTNAMPPSEIVDLLGLDKLMGDRKWHIQGACAKTGQGIMEAFESMARHVKDFNANVR